MLEDKSTAYVLLIQKDSPSFSLAEKRHSWPATDNSWEQGKPGITLSSKHMLAVQFEIYQTVNVKGKKTLKTEQFLKVRNKKRD